MLQDPWVTSSYDVKALLVIYLTGTWTDPLYANYTEVSACWMNREKGLVITEVHGTFTAYAIEDGKISTLDSSVLNANGSILHGRYSELANVSDDLPREYLALLPPAAVRVAAVASLGEQIGSVLVYGPTQCGGMAATQIASSKQNAVIAVAYGNNSGSIDMKEALKSTIPEPGTAVPEEYTLFKTNFCGLVKAVLSGDEKNIPCLRLTFVASPKQ